MATVSTLEGRRIDRETAAAIRRMEDFLQAIREIRSEPPVIEVRVGEYLEFSEHLEIIAFDSTGTLLGPVPTYNQSLYPGAAELHNRGVIGVHAGESILKIEVPLWHQSGGRGPAPEVEIPVRVEPDEGTN